MKNANHYYSFSFITLFAFVFSACTTEVDIVSTTPVQAIPTQVYEDDSAVPTILAQEPKKDGTRITQFPTLSKPESLIAKVQENLSQRLAIKIAEIRLVEAREVIWPDASLGCAQSGMMYAQVLTPGLSVQLEALGQMYEYHTDLNGTILLCDSVSEGNVPNKDSDKNIDDGWPNETKDNDVVIATPVK